MAETLASGYYWVNYHGEWMPAHYSADIDNWSLCGYDGPVHSDELGEIGDELTHS
jgi:hypothetical protein